MKVSKKQVYKVLQVCCNQFKQLAEDGANATECRDAGFHVVPADPTCPTDFLWGSSQLIFQASLNNVGERRVRVRT